MSKKHLNHQHHEEHVDESWLIPYADILTLLLALFIVLFASSQVDQKKFEQIAQSFNSALSGSNALLNNPQGPSRVSQGQTERFPSPMTAEQDRTRMVYAETVQLIEAKQKMDQYISDNNLNGSLETVLSEEGMVIRIKDTALYPSGSAVLLPDSRAFASQIANMLATLPQRVIISGHTDSVPINTAEFPTNWDLSSKRALNFMKFVLNENKKLDPAKFSAIDRKSVV